MSKISYNFSDNWIDFSYDDARYLDALASLLHVQGDCVAVIKEDNSFYISYNSKNSKLNYSYCKNLNKYTEMILKLFNDGNSAANKILETYLSFNVDFIDLVKKKINHVPENIREQLEEIKKLHKNFDGKVNLEALPFLNKYQELIYNKALSKEDFELFLRPIQDSYKLHHILKEKELKFNIIDNINELHAEYNLSKLFDRADILDNNYIGISKLSCGYCHNSLEYSHHEHRGTHGVCDNKWKMSSLITSFGDKFKSSIPAIKEFNQGELPVQYRKLSMDDFEKDIQLTLFNKVTYTNLYELKHTPYLDNNYWNVDPINVIGMNLDDLMNEYE